MTTMSSERAEEPMTPASQHEIPGKVLAAQREVMGWTVEQVADQLKLAVRQVVALEAGDYASLPSPAVTRGFVRAYAKLMKLDPAPLVARIAIDTPGAAEAAATTVRRPSPASFSQAKFPSHGKRSSLPLGWIAAAVVVVAAAGAAWKFGVLPGSHGESTAAAPAASNGASPEAAHGSSTETLQNPAVPLISVPGAASAPAPGPVVNMPATTATGAPPTAVPAAPASPVTSQGQAAQPAAAATQPAGAGANALVLNVREDSWVEVRPAKGGAPLISRLVKAGSTETFAVDQPVRLTVGNPGGVSATLRGAAVTLPQVPGKTIARVNLQ
ncbi:helix-turn-helix domain-containing protein [Massilia sp. LXY-6]|uniref:helix-turn-helix domain-containing protein n=1 Tax=Massilia sp. LXY-6 TaxID=3379823 RepID=UPI003EE1CB82